MRKPQDDSLVPHPYGSNGANGHSNPVEITASVCPLKPETSAWATFKSIPSGVLAAYGLLWVIGMCILWAHQWCLERIAPFWSIICVAPLGILLLPVLIIGLCLALLCAVFDSHGSDHHDSHWGEFFLFAWILGSMNRDCRHRCPCEPAVKPAKKPRPKHTINLPGFVIGFVGAYIVLFCLQPWSYGWAARPEEITAAKVEAVAEPTPTPAGVRRTLPVEVRRALPIDSPKVRRALLVEPEVRRALPVGPQ